jgi:oligopeptide transport system substrate-binding protein
MAIKRVRPSKVLVGTQFSRRDFLKMSGTGLAGAALLGTAGCGVFEQSGGTGGGGGGGALNVNFGAEIRYLDSALATDEISFEILVNTMEGLYRLDPDQKPVPAAAEGAEVSKDGLTYTFTLRDGTEWSNGDPVTSQDYKYAWLKVLNPDTASEYSYIIYTFVRGAAEYNAGEGSSEDVAIETPDDRTLRVTLVSKSPFFLQLTSFPLYFPQQQKYVEQQGDDYAQDADTLIYNGPYVMTQGGVGAGGTTVLEKNDRYWGKANVAVQRINGRIVKDSDTALNLYEAGELDITGLVGDKVAKYEDSPEFYRRVQATTFYGELNHDVPALRNLNIRRALMTGFDRKILTERILANGSEPAYALVPPAITPGPGDQTFRQALGDLVPTDTSGARQLWEQGVEELGETPRLKMLFDDSTFSRDIATFIQGQYKENLGADLEIETTTFEAGLARVQKKDYQVSFVSGWGADYNDPMTFLDLFLSDSPLNNTSWANEHYDELINGAKQEGDQEKRMQMMLEAEPILFDEAVMIPEYYSAVAGLKKPYFKGFVPHDFGGSPDFKYASIERK